jgi:excisionase family DNA binding protein
MPRRKPIPKRTHVTVAEAAEYLDVAPKTIRKWIAEGRLSAVRPGPRTIRIDLAELERLAEPCGPASPSDPVERIAKLVAHSPLTDDQVDRLASLLRSGATA